MQALLPTRLHPITRNRFTLLDTFDNRVRRSGARLTQGGVNGTAFMTWRPCGGGQPLKVRVDQAVSFAWDLPDCPLRQTLARVIGVRRLLPQADAEECGSLLDILDSRGKTVARLRIESGRARLPKSGSAWQTLPTVLTLVGLRGYEDTYTRLLPLIESRPGIECCHGGVYGLTLRQLGVPERDDLSSFCVDLQRTVRADVGTRQIHRALLAILVANEPGLRANLDTEFLHDFRVAVRRTRSLLGQIRHVFPNTAVEHFSTEFSWIGRLTGTLRDIDVLLLALREQRDIPAAALELVTSFVSQAQQQAHHELVRALSSDRYQRLLAEWTSFLEQPAGSALDAFNAAELLVDVVSARAWRLTRRISDRAKTIDEHTPPTQLHELRIDAKKLRYLVDVTPSLYDPDDLERILCGLKKLQRVLGDFNDAEIQHKRLLECERALGAAGVVESGLAAVRQLVRHSRQHRQQLRAQVDGGLDQFCASTMRSACRRVFKRSPETEDAR